MEKTFIYSPILFVDSALNDFLPQLQENGAVQTIDTLRSQLGEYIKTSQPKVKFNQETLENSIDQWFETNDAHYGTWVYYPWLNKVVRILNEREFVLLRTSRNQYKITAEEQAQLFGKTIGIIGLSVGHSIAMTMSNERIFSKIKLADFDTLDLSNLNRIRASVLDIGIPKVILTAREIAELDPYLNIELFEEGINHTNVDVFVKDLDLLVEECDSLEIKILARETAKRYRVPVIMDTSDRGMIDIERFDLEPDRSIMHGLVADVSYQQVIQMTKTEKLPITMKLAGIFDLSPRLKASMMELDETITTWPQLASAVNYGGGITCDLSRKILLNQITISGRFYLDHAAQFESNLPLAKQELYVKKDEMLTKEYMLGNVQSLNNIVGKDFPSNEQIEQMVEKANMAPSGGNSQPWKWLYSKGVLHLFHESALSKSLLDYSNFGSYLAFGAALYNLELAANHVGYHIQYQLNEALNSQLIYSIVFEKHAGEKNDLYDYIPLRQTNRNKGTQKNWDTTLEQPLKEVAASIGGCELNIISDRALMKKLAAISAAGERWRILDRQGHHDTFVEELRWTEEDIEMTEDGLDLRTLGMSMAEVKAFEVAKDYEAIAYLKDWNKGKVFEKAINEGVENSCAIGLISCPLEGLKHWIVGGMSVQKTWLKATQMNVDIQPISAFMFLFQALNNTDLEKHVPSDSMHELKKLQADFVDLMGIKNNELPLFMFKISIAEKHVIM